MKELQLFKAFADESRLAIINLLSKKPYCVEDLADELKLAVSTVSAHLKKMQQAGLVYPVKVQYYSMYHLKEEIMQKTLQELLPRHISTLDRAGVLRDKVLKTYFKDGKVERLPVQNKKRWIVYLEIIKLFKAGKDYSEQEINLIIQNVHEDYCLIRRELVDEGVLERANGIYRFVEDYHLHPGFYQNIWKMSMGSDA